MLLYVLISDTMDVTKLLKEIQKLSKSNQEVYIILFNDGSGRCIEDPVCERDIDLFEFDNLEELYKKLEL